jgi:polygalacturonase
MNRRDFISMTPAAFGLATRAKLPASGHARIFDVHDFGAVPDGKTMNTSALQAAIEAASTQGGGLVYVPPGVYLTGGIELKSRIALYLEAGATLLGSTKFDDYVAHAGPPAEGDANARHLIFAQNAEDISIFGTGVIDGQGQTFWKSAGRPPTSPEDMWKDVVAFDWKPSPMLEFVSCTNLRIEDITIQNAPSWTLRPVDCETAVLRGIRIRNPKYGPNTDGIDITASRNVFVSDCDISCGDDAICIKSENPYGPTRPTANITITNCVLTTCCNGFKIGTATHGAIRNIVFSNSIIDGGDGPLNEWVIAGLAIEMVDGGTMDGVMVSNIRMRNVRTPIFVRLGTRKQGAATHLRNISIRGIDAVGAVFTSSITGVPGHPVQDVSLSGIRISSKEQGFKAWGENIVPELQEEYPEARMFGRLPSFGVYVRHAERVRLREIDLYAEPGEDRSAIVCDDVDEITISGLESSAMTTPAAMLTLRDVRRAFIHGCRAPANSSSLLSVTGSRSASIVHQANDTSAATIAVNVGKDVPAETINSK